MSKLTWFKALFLGVLFGGILVFVMPAKGDDGPCPLVLNPKTNQYDQDCSGSSNSTAPAQNNSLMESCGSIPAKYCLHDDGGGVHDSRASSSSGGGSDSGSVPSGSSSEATSEELKPCKEAHDEAEKDCVAGGQASQLAMMMQMMSRNMGGTSAYAACQAMKAQGITSLGGAIAVYMACQHSIGHCKSECAYETEESKTLNLWSDNKSGQFSQSLADSAYKAEKRMEDYEKECSTTLSSGVKMQAIPAVLQSMTAFMGASQCDSIVKAQLAGTCTPQQVQAGSSFACNPTTYCAANTKDPQCTAYVCSNPQTAAGNPACGTGATNATAFNNALPPGDNMSGMEGQGSTYAGYNSSAHPGGGGGDGPAGAGGGFGGGAAGYPGGGAQAAAGGARESGLKTDIGGGAGGGGGGGGVALGNPTMGGPGGGAGGDKLDLSRFLPNGDLAKRGLASVNATGVTGANELSNFEKITRMMNQKRKFLIP